MLEETKMLKVSIMQEMETVMPILDQEMEVLMEISIMFITSMEMDI